METGRYGRKGSPWEFNLRDVFRWCELMLREQGTRGRNNVDGSNISNISNKWEPWRVVDTLYVQRLRSREDREALLMRFKETFPEAFPDVSAEDDAQQRVFVDVIGTHPVVRITPDWVQVGHTVLRRGCWMESSHGPGSAAEDLRAGLPLASASIRPLQALARCVLRVYCHFSIFSIVL